MLRVTRLAAREVGWVPTRDRSAWILWIKPSEVDQTSVALADRHRATACLQIARYRTCCQKRSLYSLRPDLA